MRIPLLIQAAVAGAACLTSSAVHADDAASLERLVRAYPAFLTAYEQGAIIWKDGSRMPASDGKTDKTFDQKLKSASLLDQMSLPYPKPP